MTYTRNVAVVGFAASGKTVLLTALVDHLKNHDPKKLDLAPLKRNWVGRKLFGSKEQVVIRKYRTRPQSGGRDFPYETYRAAFVENHTWPAKTYDLSQHTCVFERNDWKESIQLSFLDFPGERFADAAMLKSSYAQWSDSTIKMLQAEPSYQSYAKEFLDCQQESPFEATLLFTYRLALARLRLRYQPCISPSVFALDQHGEQPKTRVPEEMATSRLSGLDEDSQFAPMSATLREKNPELAQTFSKSYDRYRNEFIAPQLSLLKGCHSLLLLIDICGILATGVERYNADRRLLELVLASCEPGGTIAKRIWNSVTGIGMIWPAGWIKSVAFVAPKLDLVLPADKGKHRDLTEQMVSKLARDLDIPYHYFTCGAINSTEPDPTNSGRLIGHPLYMNGARQKPPVTGAEPVSYPTSPLPDTWPDHWKQGDFVFPPVYPHVPAKLDEPCEQVGLEEILNYLMEMNSHE